MNLRMFVLIFSAVLAAACGRSPVSTLAPSPDPSLTASPSADAPVREILVTKHPFAPLCERTYHPRAWLDGDSNGVWDAGESPLAGVQFHIDGNRYGAFSDQRDFAPPEASDAKGMARLSVRFGWEFSIDCVTEEKLHAFVVYPEVPSGYRLTTDARLSVLSVTETVTLEFGFAPVDTASTRLPARTATPSH
jgi:hypothetical protein